MVFTNEQVTMKLDIFVLIKVLKMAGTNDDHTGLTVCCMHCLTFNE